jgi:hypothetical protein
MTQLGEAIAASGLDDKIEKPCPFKEPPPPEDPEPEDENYAYDDRITMATAQANSGGTLGGNLEKDPGSPGTGGTWNVLGGDPPRTHQKQVDTARPESGKKPPMVKVRGKLYPYTVAAHHLIPGNASLYESDLFNSYMKRGGKMDAEVPGEGEVTFEVTHNIGYNVNGSHNGVWLPGSYAIVAGGDHPGKKSWEITNSPAGDIDWCHEYMAAVAKKTGGQFHDTHKNYNTNALKVLEKGTVRLQAHQIKCKDCKKAPRKHTPPYRIKVKLYNLSVYFRKETLRAPSKWKDPWLTSDQVMTDIFGDRSKKALFIKRYKQATK